MFSAFQMPIDVKEEKKKKEEREEERKEDEADSHDICSMFVL